jgi:hypothetical protein
MINNRRKVVVAYRVVPNEPENCVVVMTESLDAGDHDALINLINSSTAQTSYELGEAMARAQLPDGRNMLAAFHTTNRMQKVATKLVEMCPNNNAAINLAELNNIIAQQKGVTIDDLALGGAKPKAPGVTNDNAAEAYTTGEPVREMGAENDIGPASEGVITDDDLAKSYRSQADRLRKEAAALRRQAEDLVPSKKSTKKAAEKTVSGG